MGFSKNIIWVGGATFLSLLAQLLIAKSVAIKFAVSDFGLVGQFLSLLNILQLIGGGVISSAIVKYISEYKGVDSLSLSAVYNTSLSLIIFLSCFSTVLLIIFAKPLSCLLFMSSRYNFVIVVLGIAMLPYNFSKLVLSVLSGLSKIELYGLMSGAISIVLLLVCMILYNFNNDLQSIFYSFPTTYFLMTPIFYLVAKRSFSPYRLWPYNYSLCKEQAKKILFFALMPMITMLLGPLSQIVIRVLIADQGHWEVIGQWQAINKISDAYMMVVSMVLLNYVVPLLSPIKSASLLKFNVKKIATKITLFAVFVFIFSCAIRENIILLLYSKKYLEMKGALQIQFLGDFFRVMSFAFVYVLIAKAKVKLFLIVETLATILLLFFTVLGYHFFRLEGMVWGYLVNAVFFFIFTIFAVISYFKGIDVEI